MKRKFNKVDIANEMRSEADADVALVCFSVAPLKFDAVCMV